VVPEIGFLNELVVKLQMTQRSTALSVEKWNRKKHTVEGIYKKSRMNRAYYVHNKWILTKPMDYATRGFKIE
jgi:hypothetical protein